MLSQLSYTPDKVVGLGRLELPTSRLSGVRSNHLSYKPLIQLKGLSPVFLFLSKRIRRRYTILFLSLKGGDPAAGSPTATLLRLRPSRLPYRGRQPPLARLAQRRQAEPTPMA